MVGAKIDFVGFNVRLLQLFITGFGGGALLAFIHAGVDLVQRHGVKVLSEIQTQRFEHFRHAQRLDPLGDFLTNALALLQVSGD